METGLLRCTKTEVENGEMMRCLTRTCEQDGRIEPPGEVEALARDSHTILFTPI